MRDLAAEALGDINMGQTHRLNRMAIGGSAQASGQYRQFASDDSLVAGYFDRQRPLPPPGPGRRAISPTMQRSGGQLPPLPAIMPGQRGVPTLQGGNMDIARQLQASFPKGGKSKGPRFSSHEAEYPLPARLLAPRMPGPRGAKQARQVSQPMMGRYPVQSPLPPRPAPRPVTQAPVRSLSKGKKKKDRSVSGSDSELAKTPLPVKKL